MFDNILFLQEAEKLELKRDEIGEKLREAIQSGEAPRDLIEIIHPYFSSVNQVTSFLAYAPQSFKEHQLGLYAKVLSRISPDAVVEQIQKLPVDDIKNMLHGALEHCSQQFEYQNLVELCFYELIRRRVEENSKDFNKLITTLTADITFCKEKLPPNTVSCIMDKLAEYRFEKKTILDLVKGVKEELTPEEQYQLRGLLEILRFNQDRRKEYFDKVEKNLGIDYSWLASTLSEQAKADNHISDEKYANLKRQYLVNKLIEDTTQTWHKVDEINFFKASPPSSEGVESLLKTAPFEPTDPEFQQLKKNAKDAQEPDKDLFKKELKKLIETPRVVAYGSPLKFAVRLYFAKDAVIEKVIQGNKLSPEDMLYFDINDSDNLNQSLIQEELKHRERLRIAEATVKKQDIQNEINLFRKEQIAGQEKLKKLGGVEELEEIKKLQQEIDGIDVQLGEGKEQKLAEVREKIKSKSESLAAVTAEIQTIENSLGEKQRLLSGAQQHLRKYEGFTQKPNNWPLNTPVQNEHVNTLGEAIQYYKAKEENLKNVLTTLEEQKKESHTKKGTLESELSALNKELATLASQNELTPVEREDLTQKKQTLAAQFSKLTQNAQGWDKYVPLQENQKRLASDIESKNQELKKLDAELQTKRDMFDSLRNSFPAASIKKLKLSSQAETNFRQLLELKSVLKTDDWDVLKDGFAKAPINIKKLDEFLLSPISESLDNIPNQKAIKQLFDAAFEKVKSYQLPQEYMPLKSQREIFEDVKKELNEKRSIDSLIRIKILDGEQNAAKRLDDMHIDSIQRRIEANAKALAVSQNQEELKRLVQKLPDSEAVTALKKMLKEAYPENDLKKYLGMKKGEIDKLHGDIDAAIDRLNNMASCLKEGKSFVANDIESYKGAVEQLKKSYGQKEPKFESLSFKVKHSAKEQTIKLKNAAGEVVHECQLQLENALPFSLRKDSNGSCWLSYGGSRGARVSKLSNDPGRLFSNLWMIGHGQYGSVAQATNLFTLDEVAVKKVYTQSDQALDAGLLKNLLSRELFARADNLSDSERRINEIFIKQLSTAVPQSVQQPVKLGDYSADAAAVVRLDAQILAKGNSFDKFSEAERNTHSKADAAYHNPSKRYGFNLNRSIGDSVAMCGAMADKLADEHAMGFMHNDLKPENIMLFKGKDGRWQASLIDRATNAFQLEYKGGNKSAEEVFKEVFPGMDANQEGSFYKSTNGFYVTENKGEFYYGKEAHLQITYGARNCTLAYIAPATVEKQEGTPETIMKASDASMDDWALTAMTFGVCRKDYYLNLAKGRSVADYAVPGIIQVTGANQDELGIESPEKFNEYFGVEGHEQLMFIPANKREGEPRYLYRDLELLKQKLSQQQEPKTEESRKDTIARIDEVLKRVRGALLKGEGLTAHAVKETLLEVDKINQDSLRLIQGQAIEQVIDKHQKFEEALQISKNAVEKQKDPNSNLRVVLADVGKYVLDVLCLFPSNPNQISQAQEQLRTFDLTGMFFGQSNVSQHLIEQCLFEQQEEMAVFLIEQLKSKPAFKQLMQEKNLLELAVQMNMPKAFNALFAMVEQSEMQALLTKKLSSAHTTTKWSMNVLVSAIIQGQDEIFNAIVGKMQADASVHHSIHEAMLFCAKNNKHEYFNTLRAKFPSINDKEIFEKKPLSAFDRFMMFPSGVDVLKGMAPEVKQQFIRRYPGPVLIAGGCGNFAVVKEIFQDGALLDEDFVRDGDLNNKNILHHLLNRDAINNLDLIKNLLRGKQSASLLLRGKEGNNPLDEFAKGGARDEEKLKVIMGILEGLADKPDKQMQVLLSIKDWMEKHPVQACQEILQAQCIESNRVDFLGRLKADGFNDIKQKYIVSQTSSQEKLTLTFATIERFIKPDLAPLLSSQDFENLKQMALEVSKQGGHDEKSEKNLSLKLTVLESIKELQKAEYKNNLDRLLQKFHEISSMVGDGLTENRELLDVVKAALGERVGKLQEQLLEKEKALQSLIKAASTEQSEISAGQAEEIKKLQSDIQELTTQYNAYRPTIDNVDGLQQKLAEFDKAISDTQQETKGALDALGKRVGLLQEQLLEKEKALQSLIKAASTEQSEISAGQAEEIKKLQSDIQELTTQYKAYRPTIDNVDGLQQKLAEFDKAISDTQQETKGALDALGKRVGLLQEQLLEKEKALQSLIKAASTEQSEISAGQAEEIKKLQSDIQELTTQYKAYRPTIDNVDGLQQKLAEFDKAISDTQQETKGALDALGKRVGLLQEQLLEKEKALQSLIKAASTEQSEISAGQAEEIKKLQSDIQELTTQYKAYRPTIDNVDGLQQKLAEFDKAISDTQQETKGALDALGKRVGLLQEQLLEKEKALQSLIKAASTEQSEISAGQAEEIKKLQSDIQELTTQYKAYRPTIDNVDGLQQKLAEFDKAISDTQQETKGALDALGKRVGLLQEQLLEKEKALQSLIKAASTEQSEISAGQAEEIKKLQSDIQELTTQYKAYRPTIDNVDGLQQKLAEFDKAISDTQQETKGALDALGKRVGLLQEQLLEKEKALQSLIKAASTEQSEISAGQAEEIKKLQSDIQELTTQYKAYRPTIDNVDGLQQKLAEFDKAISDTQQETKGALDALGKRVGLLQEQLLEKEKALQSLIKAASTEQSEISAGQAEEIKKLQSDIQELTTQYNAYRPTIDNVDGLQQKLAEFDKAISDTQQETKGALDALGKRVDLLEAENKETKKSLQDALSVIEKMKEEFSNLLLSQNKELMRRVTDLEQGHNFLQEKLKESQAENEGLRLLLQKYQKGGKSPLSAPNTSLKEVVSVATQTLDDTQDHISIDGQNAGTQTPPQFNATSTGSQIKQQSFFQPPAPERFKLFGASMVAPDSASLNTEDKIIKSINFQENEVSKEDSRNFLKESGHTVYTNQGQSYKFHYDPNNPPAKAQLFKDQLPVAGDSNRQLKIALAVMNMIENVLAKGDELHVDTKDPFIAAIANLYIKKIKEIEIDDAKPFSGTITSVSPVSGDDSTAAGIFESIMKSSAYQMLINNPENVTWIQEFKAERAPTPTSSYRR